MEELIRNIEAYFKEDWQTVLNKGIEMLLSPQSIVEIWYYYCIYANNSPLSRDNIIYLLADMKVQEIISFLLNIKKEIFGYLSSKA